MGAWGTALYSNDTASDIRGDYVDLLRRGNSNEEALKKLMEKIDIASEMRKKNRFSGTHWQIHCGIMVG